MAGLADEHSAGDKLFKILLRVRVYRVGIGIRTLGELYLRTHDPHEAQRPALGLLFRLFKIHYVVGEAGDGLRFPIGGGKPFKTFYFHTGKKDSHLRAFFKICFAEFYSGAFRGGRQTPARRFCAPSIRPCVFFQNRNSLENENSFRDIL